MPFLIDDILVGLPLLFTAARAVWCAAQGSSAGGGASPSVSDVEVCRSAVPIEPGLKPTTALLGGYMYSGNDPAHVQYLQQYLDTKADEASGEDHRRVLAFKALQGREGSTAALNTYDNQVFTWGTGWGGLGGLGRVMDRLVADIPTVHSLAACGVQYLGQGNRSIVDTTGNIDKGKHDALEVIRATPALMNLFIALARDQATRDAVTDAQLDTFTTSSASIPGSETISTQALFNLASHLKHWAPGYMTGVVEAAAQTVPGATSPERDRSLAVEIVKGFYGRAGSWVPDWRQMQKYVLHDMRDDGLDVTGDPVLSAAAPPLVTKTAAGCGSNWASFKTAGGCGGMLPTKTAGGCGNEGRLDDDTCGNWGPWGAQFRLMTPPSVHDVRVVGGPGGDPRFVTSALHVDPRTAMAGFENAREVFVEPETAQSVSWGETTDPTKYAAGTGIAPTPDQVASVTRGIVAAVQAGEHDPPAWSQMKVGDYDLMVTNEPLAVHGIRLPTAFDDAVIISNTLGVLPITPAISDARWSSAQQVYAQPLANPAGATGNDPDQVVRYNVKMGPNTGEFRDGFWKELVVVPGLQPQGRGSMAQYGFKIATGMYEHGGPSNHNKSYKDYSDTPTYVSRRALKNGVEVDLLDEYAAGGPLGGPLPDWLVMRLRSGEVTS